MNPNQPQATLAEDGCSLAAFHIADLSASLDLAIRDMMRNESTNERVKLYAARHLITLHEYLKVETNKMLVMSRRSRLPDHLIISEPMETA